MNLTDAICSLLWPSTYKIEQSVIFLCTSSEHAVLAEILFTRLAQGYIHDGGGFSYYAAGRSNNSALQYTTSDWEHFWKWTLANIPVLETHKRERALWEAQKCSDNLSPSDNALVRDVLLLASQGLVLESTEESYLATVLEGLQDQIRERQEAEAAVLSEVTEAMQNWEEIARALTGYSVALEMLEALGGRVGEVEHGEDETEEEEEEDELYFTVDGLRLCTRRISCSYRSS